MPLSLDLLLLESDERFQRMCFRLARKEYPAAVPVNHASWDGGRDIILFSDESGDVVWQCKFTRRGLTEIKAKVLESLDTLDQARRVSKWILCAPVDPTGKFLDWLKATMPKYPFIESWDVWGRESLLMRLDNAPDVLEAFFYPVWKDLESKFRTDALELVHCALLPGCGWMQQDQGTLEFVQATGSDNDLLFDVIVRSRGTIQSLVHGIRFALTEVRPHLSGLPGTGLLYAQITYVLALDGGRPGIRVKVLDPPLLVNAGEHQRFTIRCTDTGYSWTGFLQLTLLYAGDKELTLPAMFLAA